MSVPVTIDNLTYNLVENRKAIVIGYAPAFVPVDLTIPGKVVYDTLEYDVTGVSTNAFSKLDTLKTLIIERNNEPITVEYAAFSECPNLTDVRIYRDEMSNNSGFYNSPVKNITVPASGLNIVNNDISDTVITLNIITDIKNEYLGWLPALQTLIFSDNVTNIPQEFCTTCEQLTEIQLSSRLESIGDGAFMQCKKLKQLTIPATVSYIGNNIIDTPLDVVNFQHQKLPRDDDNWYNIKPSNIVTGYQNITTNNDYDYVLDGNQNVILTNYKGVNSDIRIPALLDGHKVVDFGSTAFKDNNILISVVIPKEILNIRGFINCSKLKSVVVEVNQDANVDTTQIKYVNIKSNAFYNCKSLRNFTLKPVSLEEFKLGNVKFGNYVFMHCEQLSVDFGTNIFYTLSTETFTKCKLLPFNISDKKFNDLLKRNHSYFITPDRTCIAIMDNDLAPVKVYKGISNIIPVDAANDYGLDIMENAYVGNDAIIDLVVPSIVHNIGSRAFAGCHNLQNVSLIGEIKTMGATVFADCPKLKIIKSANTPVYSWDILHNIIKEDPEGWDLTWCKWSAWRSYMVEWEVKF